MSCEGTCVDNSVGFIERESIEGVATLSSFENVMRNRGLRRSELKVNPNVRFVFPSRVRGLWSPSFFRCANALYSGVDDLRANQ